MMGRELTPVDCSRHMVCWQQRIGRRRSFWFNQPMFPNLPRVRPGPPKINFWDLLKQEFLQAGRPTWHQPNSIKWLNITTTKLRKLEVNTAYQTCVEEVHSWWMRFLKSCWCWQLVVVTHQRHPPVILQGHNWLQVNYVDSQVMTVYLLQQSLTQDNINTSILT